jgi:hypothetical protein
LNFVYVCRGWKDAAMPEHEADASPKVVEVGEYGGESSITLAATQLGSKYSETRKRQVVD